MADGLGSNRVIDRFVESWRDISSVYEKLALEVKEQCDHGLSTVKCIISHRAKSTKSLKASIQRRQRARINEGKGPYQTEDQIKVDMVDLAGVRIALYFPDDSTLVEKYIYSEFDEARPAVIWGVDQSGDVVTKDVGRRFIGYRASHFRVRLKERYGDRKRREELVGRTVEIQVTTVVMHAWADVHHDLIYKPYSGELSEDEKRILDLINGLAHAGEVALQQLQALLTRRSNQLDRKFEDQHELATWLKSHIATKFPDSFKNHRPRMELSNLLLHVLRILELDTPRRFQECLETLQNMDSSSLTPPLNSTVLVLQRMSPLLNERTGPHGVDLTCWALLQICAWKTQTHRENSFEDARRKAFIMINSHNMALSLGCDRRVFDNRSRTGGIGARLSDLILPLLLSRKSLRVTEDVVIDEVENLWQVYLSALRMFEVAPPDVFSAPYDSSLLWLLSCALSGLGIVALPHSVKILNDPSKALMWPGILGWPSKELEIMHGKASSLYSGCHRSLSERTAPVPKVIISSGRSIGPVKETPQTDSFDYIFVLMSNGTWLDIRTKSLTRESSWKYSSVSFTNIQRGDQWAHLMEPMSGIRDLTIVEGDSECSLETLMKCEEDDNEGPKTRHFRGQPPKNGGQKFEKFAYNPLQITAPRTVRERDRESQMRPPEQRWAIQMLKNTAAEWDIVNLRPKPPLRKPTSQKESGNPRPEPSPVELDQALRLSLAVQTVKEQEPYAKKELKKKLKVMKEEEGRESKEREMEQRQTKEMEPMIERGLTEEDRERALIEEEFKRRLLKKFKEREPRERELRQRQHSVGVNRDKQVSKRELESEIRKNKLSRMETSHGIPQDENTTNGNSTEWEYKVRENVEGGVRDRRLREREPAHRWTQKNTKET